MRLHRFSPTGMFLYLWRVLVVLLVNGIMLLIIMRAP